MASTRTKKVVAPTAASGRKTRIPGLKAPAKPKPALKAKKTTGRAKGSKVTKKTVEDGIASKKKKRRGSTSVATKMKKRRDASRAKRGGNFKEEEEEIVKLPKGAPKPAKVLNAELNEEGMEWEAEKVVGSRIVKGGKREYFVKWTGWPASKNSWEPAVNLVNSFELITEFDEANPNAA